MIRTLVIASHPSYDDSLSQRFLAKVPRCLMSVFICLTKLRGIFDLEIELERLQTIDRLIFQFPPLLVPSSCKNEMLDRYGLGGSQTLLIK